MVLTRREKYIAIGLVVTLGLVVLNWAVLSPLSDWGGQLSADEARAERALHQEKRLFEQDRESRQVWAEITREGLKSQPWEADSQLEHALSEWAVASGVKNVSMQPERQAAKDGFVQVGFAATGTGTSAAVAKLLWQIEQATIPVRIESFDVASSTGGVDDLRFHLTLSTISVAPGHEQAPRRGAQTPLTVAQGSGEGS